MWKNVYSVFFLVLLASESSSSHVLMQDMPKSLKVKLIHRHSSVLDRHGLGPGDMTHLQRVEELIHIDATRMEESRRRRLLCRQAGKDQPTVNKNDKVQFPVASGRRVDTKIYRAELEIGTPPQKVFLGLDTGSELTWLKCGPSEKNPNGNGMVTLFRPDYSSSFRTIPCSSALCMRELSFLTSMDPKKQSELCKDQSSPCKYNTSYMDETSAGGIYAYENVTFDPQNGIESAVKELLIGCSYDFSNSQDFRGVHGLLGLNFGNHSFVANLARNYGNKFSYCLGDYFNVDGSSYFTFGDYKPQLLSQMQYTKFEIRDKIYYVNIKDVSVGGLMLNTPPEIWNFSRGGGANLDTGATYPILPSPVYIPVMVGLIKPLRRFKQVKSPLNMIDYCFSSTGFQESMVPKLVFHFVDGQQFQPPPRSYVIEAAEGVRCIAIMENRWTYDIPLGNLIQQNFFWEYDLKEGKLGFAPANCL